MVSMLAAVSFPSSGTPHSGGHCVHRLRQRYGLLALRSGHGAKGQAGRLRETPLPPRAAEDIAEGFRRNRCGGRYGREAVEQAKTLRFLRP